LHFNKPNPNIDFKNSPVYVNDRLINWETNGFPRKCGVSAFGMSGTNSHIILEEAVVTDLPAYNAELSQQIFTLSAKDSTVLKRIVEKYLHFLTNERELNFMDLCFTANCGGNHFSYRLAVIAQNTTELLEKLTYLNQMGFITDDNKSVFYGEVYPSTGDQKRELKDEEVKRLTMQAHNLISNPENGLRGLNSLLELSRLYIQGANINWELLYEPGEYRRVSLPTYPFKRERHWIGLSCSNQSPSDLCKSNNIKLDNEKQESKFCSVKSDKYKNVILTGKNNNFYSRLEVQIAQVFGEVLGFETINIYDDLYDLGGNSILAVEIAENLKGRNINVTVTDILTYKTVAQIAANIKPALQSSAAAVENRGETENVKEYLPFYNLKELASFEIDEPEHKELKIVLQDMFRTYLCNSLPLCALFTDERLLPWFYEHFINIFANVDESGYTKLDFVEHRAPYKEVMYEVYLGYRLLEKEPKIVDFVIDKINKGYYVVIYVDEYYLPVKSVYQKEHYVHNSIIYGYDNTTETFLGIGFNAELLFTYLTFKYNDLEIAFEKGKSYYHISAPWCENNAIELLKLKDYPVEYPFDMQRFLTQLGDYLASVGDNSVIFTYMMSQNRIIHGIDVYDQVVECLNKLLEGTVAIDYRAIHLLVEHKKIMLNRLRYINLHFYNDNAFESLIAEFSQIVEQIESIRKKFLNVSFSISSIESSLQEIFPIIKDTINSIPSLKTLEQNILKDIFFLLQSRFPSSKETKFKSLMSLRQ
jgi:hypothetical protein